MRRILAAPKLSYGVSPPFGRYTASKTNIYASLHKLIESPGRLPRDFLYQLVASCWHHCVLGRPTVGRPATCPLGLADGCFYTGVFFIVVVLLKCNLHSRYVFISFCRPQRVLSGESHVPPYSAGEGVSLETRLF